MPIVDQATFTERIIDFVLAPVSNPELLPSLLPIMLGAFIIELYFGKHKTEVLGWNTSVGNSIIWVSTGLNLLLTEAIDSTIELYVSYFILGMGILVGYMDFFHKWSEAVAFRASSADVIYPLAYVTIVIVKTGIPADESTIKAAVGFIIGSILFFHLIRGLETPAPDEVADSFDV